MSQLTTQQIDFIHQHIKAFTRIDWIEVRYEIVDHIASIIEQKWVDDPTLSFQSAYRHAINQLDHGKEIERIVRIKKRSSIKNYIVDYFKCLTDVKHIMSLVALMGLTLLMSYYLISAQQFIQSIYVWWVVMVIWFVFMFIDKIRLKVTPHSKSQSLKFRSYNEFKQIDLFWLMPLMLMISEYRTLSLVDIALISLCVFLLLSTIWYRYFVYRPIMLAEFEAYQNLENSRAYE